LLKVLPVPAVRGGAACVRGQQRCPAERERILQRLYGTYMADILDHPILRKTSAIAATAIFQRAMVGYATSSHLAANSPPFT
jgi:hypothetical protein